MTKLVFWTRQIGWAPSYKDCSKETWIELLKYAYSKNIRYFDTAPIYWNWQSEIILWEALKDVRKNIKIISKFWINYDEKWNTFFNFSKIALERWLEESLERLQTNYIDIYMLHIPDEKNIDVHGVLKSLNDFKKKWLIKSYWLCNTYSTLLESFLSHPLQEIEYVQDFYNLIERKAEKLIFPYIWEWQQFMAYSPLYRWVLTWNTIKDLLQKDEKAINRLIKNNALAKTIKQKKIYEQISEKKKTPIENLAINFLKKSKNVQFILFGTTKKENLDKMLKLFQ